MEHPLREPLRGSGVLAAISPGNILIDAASGYTATSSKWLITCLSSTGETGFCTSTQFSGRFLSSQSVMSPVRMMAGILHVKGAT